jgi:DNA-binding MarR family transcriptional regulator
MNALDLYLLGRRLTKIGEEAMRGADAPHVPTGLRLIVTDVAEHPGSPIGEIATRTGLPQSYVSQSVARLKDRGAIETANDPSDGRRTLVRLTRSIPAKTARRGAVSIDAELGEAAGIAEPAEIVAALEALLAGFREQRNASGRPARGPTAWPLEGET